MSPILIVLLCTGELLKEQEHLRQLMGDSVEEQRRKLQERLRRRKQRQAAGTLSLIVSKISTKIIVVLSGMGYTEHSQQFSYKNRKSILPFLV